VIQRDGKILIARRPAGKHLAGFWEFPGGKVSPGESPTDALRREILEELGARLVVGAALDAVDWQYPDRTVRLLFFRCGIEGEPQALEGQEIAWVSPAELSGYEFPPADARLIELLKLG
jgi:8-oxo-dGTP diphosphatase